MARHYKTVDSFFAKAPELREFFDQNFANPREAHEQRFVWDYWHVPDQYTLVRTPAYYYFPEDIYNEFHNYLVEWGQENLGCFDISPPWLSYYVEGCYQELHADNPHGPWAFVFSLTDWERRRFTGGETQILRPEVLNYWQGFDSERGFERHDIVDRVAPEFNRLTLFDPRYPHGVKEVRGTVDPREARLVVHGWFTEPRPFVKGALDQEQITDLLNDELPELAGDLADLGLLNGYVATRVNIDANGQVESVEELHNSLVAIDAASAENLDQVAELISSYFENLTFPKAEGKSQLTVPFVFA